MIIALQYYFGDEEKALKLARLLADIEHSKTSHTLLLVRSFDTKESVELRRTVCYCARKFQVVKTKSNERRTGYPDGAYGLFHGAMTAAERLRVSGLVSWGEDSVFCCEADGCPLSLSWISILEEAHRMTLQSGKRVTGAVMEQPYRHVNGNLVAHISLWSDRASLRSCSPYVAWDIFHRDVLLAETRPSTVIRNEHGTSEWTRGSLLAISKHSAWIANVKDDSALQHILTQKRIDGL